MGADVESDKAVAWVEGGEVESDNKLNDKQETV